ncbi:MAG: nucleotidyltransferase domain-containing protein [Alphaproteobacteria bacterium]|nr:nucleotidyltransferase domain-containing protein [Alphaproteobacteria bacterium]
MKEIRLADWEISAIRTAFSESFPDTDHLWLFGSRIYPEKRGGDIDLYIETTMQDVDDIGKSESKFLFMVEDAIGEQKIDIVIKCVNSDFDLLIYHVARKEGVQLV